MPINYSLIGIRIKETRNQQGISAEELAELSNLSSVYISYIENAKRKPSLESLIKICNALGITLVNCSMEICFTILQNIKQILTYLWQTVPKTKNASSI